MGRCWCQISMLAIFIDKSVLVSGDWVAYNNFLEED